MSFGICLVVDTGRWENQWSYVLSHWQPDTVYLIGEADLSCRSFKHAISIASAADLPDRVLVLLQPEHGLYVPGKTPLTKFNHPPDCLYLFGSDHRHLTADYLGGREPEHTVYIPTDTRDDMYSWNAGAVTLYDRRLQHG